MKDAVYIICNQKQSQISNLWKNSAVTWHIIRTAQLLYANGKDSDPEYTRI